MNPHRNTKADTGTHNMPYKNQTPRQEGCPPPWHFENAHRLSLRWGHDTITETTVNHNPWTGSSKGWGQSVIITRLMALLLLPRPGTNLLRAAINDDDDDRIPDLLFTVEKTITSRLATLWHKRLLGQIIQFSRWEHELICRLASIFPRRQRNWVGGKF